MPTNSKKRSREARSVNTDLIEVFEDLASETNQIRFNATTRLLSAKYSDEELSKILVRLFRGLCSSRKAARLGFSVALTEFLARYVTSEARFSVEYVLSVLKEQTEPVPGASGQELRDYYIGRLFAAETLIKSKAFLEPVQTQSWRSLIELILELYHKKQWLQEECCWVLQQALVSFRDQPSFTDQARDMFGLLKSQHLIKTLEGIALWITYCSGDPTALALPYNMFENNNPLDKAEKARLLNVLKAIRINEDGDVLNPSTGSTWSNKLHFAWIVIFEAARKGTSDSVQHRKTGIQFSDLWTSFVDEYLFADAASEQKKYWGFLMVQHFIKDSKTPSQLMGTNFLRCFCNQVAKSERHLHGIATKTMKVILNAAESDNEGAFAGEILIHMVGTNCRPDFDKITKTKFVEKLLTMTSLDKWPECLHTLVYCMNNSGSIPGGKEKAQFYLACADLILTMVKNYSWSRVDEGEHYGQDAMFNGIRILTLYAFCQVSSNDGTIETVDQKTRTIFQARLFSALSHLITQGDDPSDYPAFAARFLLPNEGSEIQIPSMSQASKTVLAAIKRAGENMINCEWHTDLLLDTANSNPQENLKVYQAFRLLFALSIIQAFSVDADALNVLEELEAAYGAYLDHDGDVRKGSSNVVEILLGLIAKPSVLFRRVGKEVFSAFTAMIDQDGLDSMFDVLLKSENLAGQQELFEAEDDEELEEDDSDVEEVSTSGSSDNGLSSVAGESVDDEVIEFENKLAQALGIHRAEEELTNGNVQESDEEMMTDEQMTALDPIMSNMFKQHKKASHKKENKNAKENIVQFKTKVLELLEIYVQQESQNSQNSMLATIPAQCIACIQVTKSKQVSEKAGAVVKAALNTYKLSATPKPEKKVLKVAKQELRTIHENVLKPGSNLYLRTCSQASLLLAKLMLNNGASINKVWKEYSRTGKKMAADQDIKVFGALYQDWFNWLGNAKSTLAKRVAST